MSIKSVQVRDITGKTHKKIVEDMPAKPYLGQQFYPDGTISVAQVVSISKGKHGPEVTYNFEDGGPEYTRPYKEVVKIGWAA